MSKFPSKLSQKIEKRKKDNSLRSLNNLSGIDFSSNDYLGFANSKMLHEAIEKNAKCATLKNGSTGSRLLSGNSAFAEVVETKLANYFHAEAALLFNSGYAANIGLLSCIAQRGDNILYDQYCHTSIRDGIKLSNATNYGFKHNDLKDLQKKLALSNGTKFVVVESVYSMDGDLAPLKQIKALCDAEDAYLIVDEAHSTGIYGENGEGLCAQEGIEAFAKIHTFGKALGIHGACIVGSQKLIEYLINYSKPFIYTTAMPMHALICIDSILNYLPTASKERDALYKNIAVYKNSMDSKSLSPIQTCLVSGNENVKALAKRLQKKGFIVYPILHPTVPEGEERIRICIHSFNTQNDIIELTNCIKKHI